MAKPTMEIAAMAAARLRRRAAADCTADEECG
jgi:hypothetical protein